MKGQTPDVPPNIIAGMADVAYKGAGAGFSFAMASAARTPANQPTNQPNHLYLPRDLTEWKTESRVPPAAKYKAAVANSARRQKRHGGAAPGRCSLRPVGLAACPERKAGAIGPSGPSCLPPSVRSSTVLSAPGNPERREQGGPGAALEGRPSAALSFCGDPGGCSPRLSPAGAAPRLPPSRQGTGS